MMHVSTHNSHMHEGQISAGVVYAQFIIKTILLILEMLSSFGRQGVLYMKYIELLVWVYTHIYMFTHKRVNTCAHACVQYVCTCVYAYTQVYITSYLQEVSPSNDIALRHQLCDCW